MKPKSKGVTEPARFGADTNVLLALMCSWHEHHSRALSAWENRTRDGAVLVVAAHSAVECYSALTRLPAPFRVTTAQARELIEEWVFRDAELAVLQANEVLRLLQEAAEVHLAGGAIYDSIIAMSCKNAGAVEFLTFNLRHMERFHTSGFRVHRP